MTAPGLKPLLYQAALDDHAEIVRLTVATAKAREALAKIIARSAITAEDDASELERQMAHISALARAALAALDAAP